MISVFSVGLLSVEKFRLFVQDFWVRGDQHYYSIGKWLAGQALLIIIENYQLKHVHLCIITSSQYISAETERVDKNGSHR